MLSSVVFPENSRWVFKTALALSLALLACPSVCASQRQPVELEGTRVLLDLKGADASLDPSLRRPDIPLTGGASVEGILRGYDGDSIRVVDPEDGSVAAFPRAQVVRVWVKQIRTKRRTGMGAALGALVGGGIAWMVYQHNGGSPSCGAPDDNGPYVFCKGADTGADLLLGGGIASGALLGGLIGHSIRVEQTQWLPLPLPNMGSGADGRIRLGYSIPSRR